MLPAIYLGFNTNPKNGRVKALSKACLDRTYFKGVMLYGKYLFILSIRIRGESGQC